MSTNTALDQIKARVEGHTEGPWELAGGGEWLSPWGIDIGSEDSSSCPTVRQADAELIAAAPKLLAALEAVEALHRPDAETGKCEECTYAQYSMFSVRYPCPTIKAIEEALR